MKIGYARVSTEEQKLTVQQDELYKAGCEYMYQDKLSGKDANRPMLKKMLAKLRPLDIVVVTKLDRLARSTADLLEIMAQIAAAEASFLSLAEPWADTTSPAGTLIMTVFAGVAQFERERMLERCNAGRIDAKRRGVKFGPKPKMTPERTARMLERLKSGEMTRDLALEFGIARRTVYRLKMANAV